MNQSVIENLKTKLNRHHKLLSQADNATIYTYLKQLHIFITQQPLLISSINRLKIHSDFNRHIQNKIGNVFAGYPLQVDSFEELVLVSYDVLQELINENINFGEYYSQSNSSSNPHHRKKDVVFLMNRYFVGEEPSVPGCIRKFLNVFIEPLFLYLEESLDSTQLNLHLLTRYKKRSEWFYQEEIWKLANAKDNPSNKNLPEDENERKYDQKEIRLAENLYAFLFDEGLEFHVEPKSPHGRIDLIVDIVGGIGVEVKVFSGKTENIKKGIKQLRSYMDEHHMSVGYLAIFNISPHRLTFSDANYHEEIPYFTEGNKTVYLIDIHIPPPLEDGEKNNAALGKYKTTPIKIASLL